MSGYRTSLYDPKASSRMGAPLRPYNWVQWSGVALMVVGFGLFLAYYAWRFGWIARRPVASGYGGFFLFIGVALLNTRLAPSTRITPQQQARNQRVLLIIAAACAIMLGIAAIIEFTGAL